jgi:ABC-type sugar transport system ATPase subunit
MRLTRQKGKGPLTTDEQIVEMKAISKKFGAVQALHNVDLELRRGEILGLVGDNGAGKSTLMKVLSGAILPDAGQIFLEGQQVTIHNPQDANELGIAMIYQDLALFNNLDVAANIFIGRERTRGPLDILHVLDKKAMHDRAEALISKLKVNISSPKLLVAQMSGGQRQMVACARAIAFQSKVLIMDEPTAALGVTEANTLLNLIESFKNVGLSMVLITQRIPDVLAIGDRVMVLKGGERQGILNVGDCTLDDVVSLIIKGRAFYEGNPDQDSALEYRSSG